MIIVKKLLILTLLVCILTACSDDKTPDTDIDSVPSGEEQGSEIDIDLTSFSSTMAYATVSDMYRDPYRYVGSVIKVSGEYSPYFFPPTEQWYHYIIVRGSDNCCPQMLEFVLSGEHAYPDDFPEEDTVISMTGVFGIYEEQGGFFVYLAVDEIEIE